MAQRGGLSQSWDPGPLPWVSGSIYKKKFLWGLGLNPHTTTAIHKQVLTPPSDPTATPPPPPPQKKRYLGTG